MTGRLREWNQHYPNHWSLNEIGGAPFCHSSELCFQIMRPDRVCDDWWWAYIFKHNLSQSECVGRSWNAHDNIVTRGVQWWKQILHTGYDGKQKRQNVHEGSIVHTLPRPQPPLLELKAAHHLPHATVNTPDKYDSNEDCSVSNVMCANCYTTVDTRKAAASTTAMKNCHNVVQISSFYLFKTQGSWPSHPE